MSAIGASATVSWTSLPGTVSGVARPMNEEQVMADIDLTQGNDMPVLKTLAALTAVSVEECGLEPRDLMLVRIAALAAVGASPASYLLNAGAASDAGITLEDVQGVLVAVAPVIGTPRTLLAAGNITRALGFALAVLEAEVDAELEDETA
jgi:hypothetical protein